MVDLGLGVSLMKVLSPNVNGIISGFDNGDDGGDDTMNCVTSLRYFLGRLRITTVGL